MDKLKIFKISPKCYSQKGFDERGCYGCNCTDSCCKYGADFDKEAYELVLQNKDLIEPLLNQPIQKCFGKRTSGDKEYLGGNSIRCLEGETGFCIFHKKTGKGCILYELVTSKDINRRIIPSICRLFPLSWKKGELKVYDEEKYERIPRKCNCKEVENITTKNIFETQKQEIEDIFEFDESLN